MRFAMKGTNNMNEEEDLEQITSFFEINEDEDDSEPITHFFET